MLKNILLPLDGSKISECAIDYAKDIAVHREGSQITIMTVFEEPALETYYLTSETQAKAKAKEWENAKKQRTEQANQYLVRVNDIFAKAGVAVKTVAIEAKTHQGVAEIILDFAEKNKMQLIIMSTHGRSGISRWAMGSVADRVVNHSKTPVLIITPAGCGAKWQDDKN